MTLLAAEAKLYVYVRAKRQAIRDRAVGGSCGGVAARIDILSGATWPCADRHPYLCPHRNAIAPPHANTAATGAIYLAHRVAG
jgi:hypothetical protein